MATAVKKTNWFAIWVSIAVVVVLVAVIVVVALMNNSANEPAARPASAGIEQESGAIQIGTGPDVVSVYFDFFCSHCQQFESVYGDTIAEGLTDGSITLELHPVALAGLNAASGTDFSKRGSNAMYCVADAEPEAAWTFYSEVFALNPGGQGLTDEELLSLAGDAGVTGIDDCVAERTWDDLVAEQTRTLPANPATGSAGTPTLLVNGEYVPVTLDPEADITARLAG
ncbi:DsbA family protein [Microbacterium sp.]|uniref:DsbA family protein n=1 Tax=Microbacterium sp. TaxID=51671 RepID=UPI003A8429D5